MAIPAELKALPQWCSYKLEMVDNKKTKVPYEISTGIRASSTNPLTWTTFNAAQAAYQDIGGYNGICFMLSEENGIVFIDLDNCIKDDGSIEPWALEIVERFKSYTEKSQSSKGLHILIKGTKPGDRCKTTKYPHAVEIYGKARQCCTTGNTLEGYDTIENRQDELNKLYVEIFGQDKQPNTTTKPAAPSGLSDEEVIKKAKAAHSGTIFNALWSGFPPVAYSGDDSAADMGLMNMLAFWTGKDPAQMERLFSQSGLGQRDKWKDRPDYRQRTIEKAIAGTGRVYGDIPESTDKFDALEEYCHIKKDEDGKVEEIVFSPTKAANKIGGTMSLAMSKDSDDIFNFNGQIYEPNGARKIDMLLCSVAEDMVSSNRLKEVLRRVKNKLLEHPVAFDPDPYMLGVKNALVDLRTGEAREYKPEDYITDQLDVAYEPGAKCPCFIKFLEDVAPNPTDRLMLIDWYAVHAIREMYPYILFLNGLGRNGKGVYERVLKRFFGENAFSSMPLEELSVKNNRFAGADLAGKRGQIVAEAGESHAKGKRTIPTAFLKNSTGDGVIDSDQKNKGRIKFKPFYKSTIDSNDMPRIEDSSKGWIERFCKADMPFSYVDDPKNSMERKKDPRLFDKLTTPEELSGILNLILSRTPNIIKTGAITKRSGADMFAEYQKQSNSVTTFLENFCAYKPEILRSEDVALEVVYEAYQNWCDLTVSDKVSDQRFGSTVKNLCNGIKSERIRCTCGGRIRIYHGFTFDAKAYQSQVSQSVPTLSQQNKEQSQVSQDIGQNTWQYIKEKFGEKNPINPSENEKPPHFSPLGPAIDCQNTVGTDSGHLGTDLAPLGPDVDSTIEREKASSPDVDLKEAKIGPHPRKDAPTPYILIRVRFKTAYETDINGQLKQFQEGDEAEVSRERAEAWAKRGIVELVA